MGNPIYTKSQRGIIFYCSVRDVEILSEKNGFNGWIKGDCLSFISQMMLASINAPIRIVHATVLFGDVVPGKNTV